MPLRKHLRNLVILLSSWTIACGPWHATRASDEAESLWSLRPVRSVIAPPVRTQDWARSPIDQFILAGLEERGLGPARSADRRTLLRRVTFDLIGLPPTPDESDVFLADEAPDALARVVDRLLASPRYGERWGRHWLDAVRYADARDLIQLPAESDFREAWRYRDWVIAAFNRDLPYDQFITRQVAGDILQPADPNQIDTDALVATGMLAIADFVPGDVDKQQMIADYVNDQIDVVGRAFLGLTLACARCHDHKFDPISTDDYYALAGIFFSTRLIPGPVKGNTPLVRVPLASRMEIAEREAGKARDQARQVELSREINQFGEREYRSYLLQQVTTETPRYLLAAWELAHPAIGQDRPAATEFAKTRGLDPLVLTRWTTYLEEKKPYAALAALCSAPDREAAERRIRELMKNLATCAAERREREARDPTFRTLIESELLRFQADDRRIAADDAGRVTQLPNRGRAAANASPVTEVAAPSLTTVMIAGQPRSVLHFSGNELLQAPVTVPLIGSLFVVFRPDAAGPAGQRLIGWEDASAGQHGVGIMTDAAGSVHAILRRKGANGDVVAPAPSGQAVASEFQTLSITWGPAGVTMYRQGQLVGNNKGIDAVTSDPAITALRLGGPGSGASPRFQGDVAELRVYDQPLDDSARSRVEAELTSRWRAAANPPKDTDPVGELYDELVGGQSPFRLDPAERDKALPNDFRERVAMLRGELEALQKKKVPEIPQAVVVQEGGPPGTPHEGFHDAQVYVRGNPKELGKKVPRGFPQAIGPAESPVIREGSGRRELAQWLSSPKNPLPARVMVNRLWQHHFGAGIVRTSANFGAMGDPPSHPELLDHLATEFVASGWSVKAMQRRIVLSQVYGQDSAPSAAGQSADPENRLLWRVNRKRLEAEAVRDSLLAVAGRLDFRAGGPGFQELATPRRTVYLLASRTGAKTAEFGSLFDAADCSGIVERRTESIVAPQALFLLNDPLMAEWAAALGQRVVGEVSAGTEQERIRRLYELALGRPPTDQEIAIGRQLLADPSPSDAWTSYCRVVVCTNEFLFID